MPKIAAIGELLIDFTMIDSDQFGNPIYTAYPGGAPANFLAAAQARGVDTYMIAKVGKDQFGEKLKNDLNKVGVLTDYILEDADVFTTLAFVTLDNTGNRSFDFARKPGADTKLDKSDIPQELLNEISLLHFGSLSLTHKQSKEATLFALNETKSKGKLISFDPNVRLNLWENEAECRETILSVFHYADIIKISEEEIEFLWDLNVRDGVKKIFDNFPTKVVFITQGSKGASFATPSFNGHVSGAKHIDVVDTTGAGDIFGGTAVAEFLKLKKSIDQLQYDDLADITTIASTIASLSTESHGGITSLPNTEKIISYKERIV